MFLAGQIGLNAPTMQIISEDVGRQSSLTLKNIFQVLKAVRSSPEKVFYITVYVTDLYASQTMVKFELEKVFPKMSPTKIPNLIFLQVPQLPKNAKVEIHVLSVLNSAETPICESIGKNVFLLFIPFFLF